MIARRIINFAGVAVMTAACAVLLAGIAGYRVNFTNSVPAGLYREQAGTAVRGSLVTVCLDPANLAVQEAIRRHYFPSGPCPGGLLPFLKNVAAVGGDEVDLTEKAIIVNGQILPNTATVAADWLGRPIPQVPRGRYILTDTQVLLVATNRQTSFDGRYIGPMDRAAILALMRPIWIP